MTHRVGAGRASAAAALLLMRCQGEEWVIAEEVGIRDPAPIATSGELSYGCAGAAELVASRATWHERSEVGERHMGRWRGSISGSAASAFPSTDVELRLSADRGTLTFMGADAPPAPESPRDGYLCDGSVSGGVCGTASGFVGAFTYELSAISVRGNVVSFLVIDADPWAPWCELQPPVGRLDELEACGHSWSVLPLGMERWSPEGCAMIAADGTPDPIDCGRMYALERCQCAFDGCFASFYTGIEVGMALSPDARELRGSLWFKSNVDAGLLRLSRQP